MKTARDKRPSAFPPKESACANCAVLSACVLVDSRPNGWEEFETHLVTKACARDQVVYFEGQATTGLFVLRSGAMKLSRTTVAGRTTVIRINGPGDPLSVSAVLMRVSFPTTAQALQDSQLCFVPVQYVMTRLDREPRFGMTLLKWLSQELSELEDRLVSMAHQPVRTRLLEMIAHHPRALGLAEGKSKQMGIRLKRQDLASLVGTTTETLVRELKKLEEQGVVRIEGRIIRVEDLSVIERALVNAGAQYGKRRR